MLIQKLRFVQKSYLQKYNDHGFLLHHSTMGKSADFCSYFSKKLAGLAAWTLMVNKKTAATLGSNVAI